MRLGEYLSNVSFLQDDPHEVPPFITFRDAHQIFERVLMEGKGGPRAIEAVRRLCSDSEAEAVTLGGTGDPETLVEYQGVGELVALFHPGYVEETSASSGIEVSARPRFVLRKGRFPDPGHTAEGIDDASDRIRAMLAVTLQEGKYGVAAPGLRWDIRLALVWTRVTVREESSLLKLSFQWRFHEHPHPLQLLQWSHEWRELVRNIQSSPEERLERIAYAWILYQVKWLGLDSELRDLGGQLETTEISSSHWDRVLELKPRRSFNSSATAKPQDWHNQTLALLARPEVGLPWALQHRFLSHVDGVTCKTKRREWLEWLKSQRRRLVTDAIVAAGEEEGRRAENAENAERVERIVRRLEKQHEDLHGDLSPWWKIVEGDLGETHRGRQL